MRENTALNKSVGIWIRVSTEDQARGDSPEIHLERARGYAKSRDWIVAEVYDLAGVSGKSVMAHPEAKRMMADIKRGHISGLIFSKLARLSRNLGEVLDFGAYFRQQNADLISLNEAIDTSTAGGRMFFNLLGVFAQWEREETTERINASFKTRAQMGKLLNKSVPYGYRVVDGQMVLHPEEAPIRRQAYELFLQCRRKYTVAQDLNAKGYRTRKGRKWEETQIKDMLVDSSAKGVYFFNRAKRIGAWKTEPKPESEWGRIDCEPIVSEAVWQDVNRILEEQGKKWKRPGRLPAQTFSKLTWCHCGGKMYVRTDSPKYLCRKCNNKVTIADLENAFLSELKRVFDQPEKLATHLVEAGNSLKDKETLIATHEQSIQKVRNDMHETRQLLAEGHISRQGFGEFYKPAEERMNQLLAELPKLQAEVDFLKVNRLSVESIMADANSTYDDWPILPIDERRKIAEALCTKLVIGEGFVDVTFTDTPTSAEPCNNLTRL